VTDYLVVDEVIEILERISAENKARRKDAIVQYEKIATKICGRGISIAFASDCGSALCGGRAIGSSDRASIAIFNDLGRVTEHCVFCHELAHTFLEHSSGSGGDHTSNLKELSDRLPESERESFQADNNEKERDANKFGRILHEGFFPGETWVL
jgi:hypothetical protein